MRASSIDYSRKFLKRLKKLPALVIDKFEEREVIFKYDIFDARIETHKLHGKEHDYWSFSKNNKYRVKFMFLTDKTILFLDIGTHDEVY